MASLSFTSAVSMRPVLAAKATKTIVSTKANALGGGGPNIPAADYKKKMEESQGWRQGWRQESGSHPRTRCEEGRRARREEGCRCQEAGRHSRQALSLRQEAGREEVGSQKGCTRESQRRLRAAGSA